MREEKKRERKEEGGGGDELNQIRENKSRQMRVKFLGEKQYILLFPHIQPL